MLVHTMTAYLGKLAGLLHHPLLILPDLLGGGLDVLLVELLAILLVELLALSRSGGHSAKPQNPIRKLLVLLNSNELAIDELNSILGESCKRVA